MLLTVSRELRNKLLVWSPYYPESTGHTAIRRLPQLGLASDIMEAWCVSMVTLHPDQKNLLSTHNLLVSIIRFNWHQTLLSQLLLLFGESTRSQRKTR